MILGAGENLCAGLEVNFRAGTIRVSDLGERGLRDPQVVLLGVRAAITVYGQAQVLGQGIDDRDPHTVQPARDLVGIVIEFTAGMQHGHDHLGG